MLEKIKAIRIVFINNNRQIKAYKAHVKELGNIVNHYSLIAESMNKLN